jgi:Fe-S-cluster containining protein
MTPLPVLNCDDCGACCETQGTPPFARTPDDRPPPELDWDRLAHRWRYDQSLPCLWYDPTTRRCRHYEFRPLACREAVVPGDENCLRFRAERADA